MEIYCQARFRVSGIKRLVVGSQRSAVGKRQVKIYFDGLACGVDGSDGLGFTVYGKSRIKI